MVYTVGTVLQLKPNAFNGKDIVTIYSSQLGKEKKVILCSAHEASQLDLYEDLSEDDKLLLPESWKFGGKGSCNLLWEDPANPETKHTQQLKVFSCIPVVIIPMNIVPIDFAMFVVSPFHKRYRQVRDSIPRNAEEGFDFHEDVEDEDGAEVVYDADKS